MSLPKGTIDVQVLADGTIRAETGDMGGVTHQQADNFLKMVQQLMGGQVDVQKAKHGHVHTHEHGHSHTDDHQHGGH